MLHKTRDIRLRTENCGISVGSFFKASMLSGPALNASASLSRLTAAAAKITRCDRSPETCELIPRVGTEARRWAAWNAIRRFSTLQRGGIQRACLALASFGGDARPLVPARAARRSPIA